MAFCEMLKRAQEGNVFFVDKENHTCEAGLYVLGQADAPEPYISGEFGAGLKIFEEARSASRLYQYIPRIGKGVVELCCLFPVKQTSLRSGCLDHPCQHQPNRNFAEGHEL